MIINSRSVSVVVVAQNSATTLDATIERLLRALTVTIEEFEIFIIDDGSTDETFHVSNELAKKYGLKVIRHEHARGAAYCYMEVVRTMAAMSFVVYIPGDNTWPNRSYLELFGNLGKADILTSYPRNLRDTMSTIDRFVSLAYTFLINLMFKQKLNYYNGLTVYPVEFLRSAPISTHGFGFQAEALLRAVFAGYSYLEIALPIDEKAVRRNRAVKIDNIASAALTVLRLFFVLRVKRRVAKSFARHKMVEFGQGIDELGASREDDADFATGPADAAPVRALNVVVTGASSGIGAALSRALSKDGHQLYICARRADKLANVASDNPNIKHFTCNVAKASEVEAFAAFVGKSAPSVDVLINCAGSFGAIGPVETTPATDWWATLEVNLLGTYLTIQHFLPLLKRSTDGRIINLSGGGAFSPFPNYSAYACSKAAIVRLTECLAFELLSDNIMVNAVAPGIVATEIHEATLNAGETKAGTLHYRRTMSIMRDGGARMQNVVSCIRALISPQMTGLTGKTISSNFDPWRTPAFRAYISDITRSDLFSMRRISVANLPDGFLRRSLQKAWMGQKQM